MSKFKPPEQFEPGNSPAEAWERWRQRYEIYQQAEGLAEEDISRQRAILLHVIGEVGLQIYNTFCLEEVDDERTVEVILNAFSSYYVPHKNTTFKRHVFFTACQSEGQTIDEFVTDLKLKSKDCEFGTLTDSLIRDRLVCGIKDDTLRGRLLRDPNLTLASALDICRSDEVSKHQTRKITTNDAQLQVHAFIKPKSQSAKSGNITKKYVKQVPEMSSSNVSCKTSLGQFNKPCSRCGRFHKPKQCPAFGQQCKRCSKKGHFAIVCKDTTVHAIQENVHQVSESESLFLGSLACQVVSNSNQQDEWLEHMIIDNIDIVIKIDTGSQVNILPINIFKHIPNAPKLEVTDRVVTAYTGHRLPLLGKCILQCIMRDKKKQCEFLITDSDAPAILGLKSSEDWDIVTRVCAVSQGVPLASAAVIVENFKDVFNGLGKLPGQHTIKIEEGAIPKVYAPRKIPFALRSKVEAELNLMLENGIITKVEEPTDWVHPIVVVKKPNGSVRICMDPRELNAVIKREHFQLPTPEEIFSTLHGSKYFTVLDASSAFWQIELDDASSRLCTFATPFGRFRFLRLPYGVKSAPEVFQKAICKILMNLQGTDSYLDDILVSGKSENEHNDRLRNVLERAKENNLKLGWKKMQLAQTQIEYLGSTISNQGIRIAEERVKAINCLSEPSNRKELQRFMGMVTYLSKFIANHADKTHYLRSLLKDGSEWIWDAVAQKQFESLKEAIATAPVLVFFNPNAPIVLSVDSSQYGLGAVLLQNNRPVAFASATLSQTQTRYAQIEKELLAIVYACEHFHIYVYGSQFTIQTDHKPLLTIVKKNLDCLSPRLQRLVLRLLRYNFELIYVPGKELYVADALSRDPRKDKTVNTDYMDGEASVVNMLVAVTPKKLESLLSDTKNDPELQQLSRYCQQGWPAHKSAVNRLVKTYWSYKEEIHESQGLLFRGQRIILPSSHRLDAMEKIHSAHQGVVSCKAKARESLFWPGMSTEVEKMVLACATCQQYSKANVKEPLIPHPIPSRPWERIGIDFMTLGINKYILVVDYFSKYVEIQILQKTSSTPVVTALKSIFARHGIPMQVVSDNGPPFDSIAFQNFAKEWDFEHITSSPYYPKSNGMAERAIQTVKGIIRKAQEDGDIYTALLHYRSTPKTNLSSPAEMLMGRKIRTVVPTTVSLYKPKFPIKKARMGLKRNQMKQKHYADQSAKTLPNIQVGESVLYQEEHRKWKPATVTATGPTPRSYRIDTPAGARYTRNRVHLRPRLFTPNAEDSTATEVSFAQTGPTPPTQQSNQVIPTDFNNNSQTDISPEKDTQIADEQSTPRRVTRSGREVRRPLKFKD